MNDTREKLLNAANRLLGRQGFAATGLKELAKEADAPWGSIYYFFPGGKMQIATEVIARTADFNSSMIERAFAENPNPIDALASIFEILYGWARKSEFRSGCAVGGVSLDFSEATEELRKPCHDAFSQIIDSYTIALVNGGVAESVAPTLASHIVASIEGAFMLTRAAKSTLPLEQTMDVLRRVIGSHLAEPAVAGLRNSGRSRRHR